MTPKRQLVTHLEQIRRTYRPEFKLEAVRKLELSKKTAKELAFELGIDPSLLCLWRKKKIEGTLRLQAESPSVPDLSELKYLRRKTRRLIRELAILKKAISYFTSLGR